MSTADLATVVAVARILLGVAVICLIAWFWSRRRRRT